MENKTSNFEFISGNDIIFDGEKYSYLDSGKDSSVYRKNKTILKKWAKHISKKDLENYNQAIKNYKIFFSDYVQNFDFGAIEWGEDMKNEVKKLRLDANISQEVKKILSNVIVSEIEKIFETENGVFSTTTYRPGYRFFEKGVINELKSIRKLQNLSDINLKKITDFLLNFIQESIRIFLAQTGSKLSLDPMNIKLEAGKIYITDIADALKNQFLPSYENIEKYKPQIFETLNQGKN